MRVIITWLCVLVFASWQSPAYAQDQEPLSYEEYHSFAADIEVEEREIDFERLKELMAEDNTVIIDLRSKEAYDHQHIKGALHLGADFTADRLAEVIPSKDTNVLLYCSHSLMPTRMIALTHLSLPQVIFHGYHNTYMLAPIWGHGGNYNETLPAELLPMESSTPEQPLPTSPK